MPALLVVVVAGFLIIPRNGRDFEVDGIYYKIVDEDSRLTMVTYKGKDWNAYDHEYRDTISQIQQINATALSV